jgi:hypothetical protein
MYSILINKIMTRPRFEAGKGFMCKEVGGMESTQSPCSQSGSCWSLQSPSPSSITRVAPSSTYARASSSRGRRFLGVSGFADLWDTIAAAPVWEAPGMSSRFGPGSTRGGAQGERRLICTIISRWRTHLGAMRVN